MKNNGIRLAFEEKEINALLTLLDVHLTPFNPKSPGFADDLWLASFALLYELKRRFWVVGINNYPASKKIRFKITRAECFALRYWLQTFSAGGDYHGLLQLRLLSDVDKYLIECRRTNLEHN